MQILDYNILQIILDAPDRQIYLVTEKGKTVQYCLIALEGSFEAQSPTLKIYKTFKSLNKLYVLTEPFHATLQSLLKEQQNGLEIGQIATIITDVLMDLLHSQFFAFSLQNIFIIKQNNQIKAKLGISNLSCDWAFSSVDGVHSKATSVWSAGVVLFYLCTGHSPYNCRNKTEIEEKIKSFDITDIPNSINKIFRQMIISMMQINGGRRGQIEDLLNTPQLKMNLPNRDW
ncbi:Kinase [Hexamita inflata]|uniref:Kinase n=1 Tax=Hexamita inflata TaxID=28002 RepID=A0AA86RK14_9EUKA|nr:Kinase [Hexamita inflata]